MKKLTFLSVMVMLIMTLAGCTKGNVSIKSSKIEENTMLIKSDGKVQVATVEDFSKSYYKLEELEQFIDENLKEFNEKVGKETAVVLDSIDQKDGKAVMVLEYENMDYYAQFNEVEAKLLTNLTDGDLSSLPEQLHSVGEDGNITKDQLLTKEGIHIVIVNEEFHLIVGDKIKYYSEGEVTKPKEIKTTTNQTVVVY